MSLYAVFEQVSVAAAAATTQSGSSSVTSYTNASINSAQSTTGENPTGTSGSASGWVSAAKLMAPVKRKQQPQKTQRPSGLGKPQLLSSILPSNTPSQQASATSAKTAPALSSASAANAITASIPHAKQTQNRNKKKKSEDNEDYVPDKPNEYEECKADRKRRRREKRDRARRGYDDENEEEYMDYEDEEYYAEDRDFIHQRQRIEEDYHEVSERYHSQERRDQQQEFKEAEEEEEEEEDEDLDGAPLSLSDLPKAQQQRTGTSAAEGEDEEEDIDGIPLDAPAATSSAPVQVQKPSNLVAEIQADQSGEDAYARRMRMSQQLQEPTIRQPSAPQQQQHQSKPSVNPVLEAATGEEAYLRRLAASAQTIKGPATLPPSTLPSSSSQSRVVLLTNMVGAGEVDDELESETAQECSKYGPIESCVVYEVKGKPIPDNEAVRIFVCFKSVNSAVSAQSKMNGRFFGGRMITASFYNEAKFNRREFLG